MRGGWFNSTVAQPISRPRREIRYAHYQPQKLLVVLQTGYLPPLASTGVMLQGHLQSVTHTRIQAIHRVQPPIPAALRQNPMLGMLKHRCVQDRISGTRQDNKRSEMVSIADTG